MNKTEIKKLISKYSEEQLRELIYFIIERNTSAQRVFMEYCKKQEAKNQTENYVQIVKEQIGNCWHVASEIIEEFNMAAVRKKRTEHMKNWKKCRNFSKTISCHGSLKKRFLKKSCHL